MKNQSPKLFKVEYTITSYAYASSKEAAAKAGIGELHNYAGNIVDYMMEKPYTNGPLQSSLINSAKVSLVKPNDEFTEGWHTGSIAWTEKIDDVEIDLKTAWPKPKRQKAMK